MNTETSPRSSKVLPAILGLFLLAPMGCAEMATLSEQLLPPLTGAQPLTESTVAQGLKEALEVGAERASKQLSKRGGFAKNPLLRLALPPELDRLASSLRSVGLGAPVDDLEDTMNRAAEKAAGEAVPVLFDAVAKMTLDDAFEILNGPETAATDYFRETSSMALMQRFEPVAQGAMKEVGLYQVYGEAVARYRMLPLSKPPAPDLETYVSEKTLDGLFSALAGEEKRIREDPAARTSALLRRVFE